MQEHTQGWQEPPMQPPAIELCKPRENPAERAFWLDTVFGPAPAYEILGRSRREALPGSALSSGRPAESLATLIHDARNMVSAMDLYCDLLDEPGVLSEPFRHYAGELRRVGSASRRLLEKLAVEESIADLRSDSSAGSTAPPQFSLPPAPGPTPTTPVDLIRSPQLHPRQGLQPGQPVASVAEELRANLNLLSALVGPAVTIGLSIRGGSHPIAMSADDLTRVLVNLARNAAEAMPQGGHIQIDLEERPGHLCLTFSDNGPGIPEAALDAVFAPGYTTHVSLDPGFQPNAWPVQHRGLGLSIVRSIVLAARGAVWASNRSDADLSAGPKLPGASNSAPAAAASSGEPDHRAPATGAILTLEFAIEETSRFP